MESSSSIPLRPAEDDDVMANALAYLTWAPAPRRCLKRPTVLLNAALGWAVDGLVIHKSSKRSAGRALATGVSRDLSERLLFSGEGDILVNLTGCYPSFQDRISANLRDPQCHERITVYVVVLPSVKPRLPKRGRAIER